MNYSYLQTQDALTQTYHYVALTQHNNLLTLTLIRPTKKNAMCPQMMNEIAYALCYAHYTSEIWVIIIQAEGDVFCAGADLKAMAGEVEPHLSSIPSPTNEVLLGLLFSTIHKPMIAKVQGSVMAGGFFFLAGCHYVIAHHGVVLGLPEVKRGLFPFQVMSALLQILPQRKVLDWCMQGYSLPATLALEWGLITHLVPINELDATVDMLVQTLLSNSPSAIRLGLQAFGRISTNSEENQLYLKKMLQNTIQTDDAKEGIEAFKNKRTPTWTGR